MCYTNDSDHEQEEKKSLFLGPQLIITWFRCLILTDSRWLARKGAQEVVMEKESEFNYHYY